MMQNPYNYTSPISDTQYFYGRTALISKIYSRIGAERPQSISLVGDPRMGKSSLLWYLAQDTCKTAYLPNPEDYIYFYMPIKSEAQLCFRTFSTDLCDLIIRKIKPILDIEDARPSYDLLKRIAEELNQRQKKIILLFDDFHLITQNETFPLEFFSFLRSLANNYNLAFVTTSHLDLQRLCVSKDVEESPFFNIFTNLSLKAFETEEALQLIEEPFQKAGWSVNSEKALVVEMAGLFPYTLQAACSILFDIKTERARLNDADINVWQNTFYEEVQGYFAVLWGWFSEDQKEIFNLIAKSKKIDKSKDYVLRDLARRSYIVNTGEHPRLFSTMFHRFVAEKNRMASPGHPTGKGSIQFLLGWLKKFIALFKVSTRSV